MNLLKKSLLLVCLSFSFLQPAPPANAGAFDQLVGMNGGNVPNVPDVPEPTRVDPDSGNDTGYSDNEGGTNNGGIIGWLFRAPTPEELAAAERAREQRRVLRKQKAEQRRQRREAESRNRKKSGNRDSGRVSGSKKKENVASPPAWPSGLPQRRPSYAYSSGKTPPSLQQPTTSVPAGTEAKALREYLFRIDILRKKSPLSVQEQSLLTGLENACRVLWAKAAAVSGLTPEERAKLVMTIPTVSSDLCTKVGTVTRDTLATWKQRSEENRPPVDDPMVKYNVDKTVALLEYQGSEFAENSLPENIAKQYDTMLSAGKVSIALKKGDRAEAVKEFLDMLVGRIGMPQASWAVEGGRIYSGVAFQALDRFMVDSMKGVGVDFNTKEFWQQVRDNMNIGQKSVYKWIGAPDAN